MLELGSSAFVRGSGCPSVFLSASPRRINSAASPIVWLLAAQAV